MADHSPVAAAMTEITMDRAITFDRASDRLVYLMGKPDQAYWEQLWQPTLTRSAISKGDRFVLSETRRQLSAGARVLDAGCGIAATVHGLAAAGYDAHGIDFAEATIREIRSHFPDLQVQVSDVRNMPFQGESFDGVWSLGVIEHFFDGYDPLIMEANRILRPGGYLFLTVPVISPLKGIKIRLGRYAAFDMSSRDRFFQFAFRKDQVAGRIADHGFELVRSHGLSGSFGLSEDMGRFSRMVLPKDGGKSLVARMWWRLMDHALKPFSHHTRFFLFRKIS